eukprot:GHVH01010150.1.p1 GENE.GHVH01010150.1~~GHVH01010150.1.p1  ORF type:complete len:738 (+),score=94.75 GHVH01010150.1:308-2521(+)
MADLAIDSLADSEVHDTDNGGVSDDDLVKVESEGDLVSCDHHQNSLMDDVMVDDLGRTEEDDKLIDQEEMLEGGDVVMDMNDANDDDDGDESEERGHCPEIYRNAESKEVPPVEGEGRKSPVKRTQWRPRKHDDRQQHRRTSARVGISRRGPEFQTAPLTVAIEEEDASFILGTAGRTKQKLARVSGSEIVVTENPNTMKPFIEIYGPEVCKKRAADYIGFVVQQRRGIIHFDVNEERDDITVIGVPTKCIGYITGRRGVCLRAIEEEWNTLMFFVNNDPKADVETEKEQLAIFGNVRNRKGAELKVMSAVEQKQQGQGVYTQDLTSESIVDDDGFAVSIFKIANEDYSYALGKHGNTRRKLAKASGAILEYIGNFGYIAGTKIERTRAMEYFDWLKRQRTESILVDIAGRSDAVAVEVPSDLMPNITGKRGANLRAIEHETSTFIFINGDTTKQLQQAIHKESETLLIFSFDRRARDHAVQKVKQMICEFRYPRYLSGMNNGRGGRGGGSAMPVPSDAYYGPSCRFYPVHNGSYGSPQARGFNEHPGCFREYGDSRYLPNVISMRGPSPESSRHHLPREMPYGADQRLEYSPAMFHDNDGRFAPQRRMPSNHGRQSQPESMGYLPEGMYARRPGYYEEVPRYRGKYQSYHEEVRGEEYYDGGRDRVYQPRDNPRGDVRSHSPDRGPPMYLTGPRERGMANSRSSNNYPDKSPSRYRNVRSSGRQGGPDDDGPRRYR